MIQKARTVSTISHGTPRGSTRHSWRRARARKGQRHASERDGESRRAAETRVRCASGRWNTGHGSRAFGHRKTHPKREGEGSREDPENPHERVPTAPARRVESRVGPLVVVVVVVVDRAVAASGTSRAPSGGTPFRVITVTRARCAARLSSRSSAAMTSSPTISSRHTSQSITAVLS